MYYFTAGYAKAQTKGEIQVDNLSPGTVWSPHSWYCKIRYWNWVSFPLALWPPNQKKLQRIWYPRCLSLTHTWVWRIVGEWIHWWWWCKCYQNVYCSIWTQWCSGLVLVNLTILHAAFTLVGSSFKYSSRRTSEMTKARSKTPNNNINIANPEAR